MINDVCQAVAFNKEDIHAFSEIRRFIYCDEIAGVFMRNLNFMGFVSFLWFDRIEDVIVKTETPGTYFFVNRVTREIDYVGCSKDLNKRLYKSHKKYDNEHVLIIPTRNFIVAQRVEAVFTPLFDCKKNVVKALYGKKNKIVVRGNLQ